MTQHFEDRAAREQAQAISDGGRSRIRDLAADEGRVEATGTDGVTMLQWAVLEGQHRALVTLLEMGADVEAHGLGGSTVLHTAAMRRDTRFLSTLLETGVDPDLPHAVTQQALLMQATGLRSDDNFHLLLNSGANVRLADRNGTTALHLAAMVNAGGQVLTLLERGADPLAEDRVGATFQNYFWTTDANIMHGQALRERRKVADWLTARDIPVPEGAAWTKDRS